MPYSVIIHSFNWIPNFLKFRFQMVQYSDGRFMGYVQCTGPTIWILDQYIRKQVGVHLTGIQMVGLSGIQMIGLSGTFQPFEYQTSWVFRSPLYSCLVQAFHKTACTWPWLCESEPVSDHPYLQIQAQAKRHLSTRATTLYLKHNHSVQSLEKDPWNK